MSAYELSVQMVIYKFALFYAQNLILKDIITKHELIKVSQFNL